MAMSHAQAAAACLLVHTDVLEPSFTTWCPSSLLSVCSAHVSSAHVCKVEAEHQHCRQIHIATVWSLPDVEEPQRHALTSLPLLVFKILRHASHCVCTTHVTVWCRSDGGLGGEADGGPGVRGRQAVGALHSLPRLSLPHPHGQSLHIQA